MTEKLEEFYDHELYKYTKDIKDADAVAYAAVSKTKLDYFPYKNPELLPNEIRANVLYAGLCHSDCLTVRGLWGDINYPVAPGHEIIAEVTEVGSEVKNFTKGEKVGFGVFRTLCGTCKFCLSDRETMCVSNLKFTYGFHFGGYSTSLQQPASHFFKLPEKLKLDVAAPLLCAGATVFTPMLKFLKPGMNTAVIGIGGLGHLAVQFLSKLGHEVTCVSSSPEKFDFFKQLGATGIINVNSEEELTNNFGKFDFIINTSSSNNGLISLIRLTARCGIFVQTGLPPINEDSKIPNHYIVCNEITFVGSNVGSRKEIQQMLEVCAEKDIYPITEHYSFEEFPKAFDKIENGKPIFRCVVNCGEYSKKNNLFK